MGKTESNELTSSAERIDVAGSSNRVQGYLAEESESYVEVSGPEKDAIAFVVAMQESIEAEVKELRSMGKYPPSLIARVNSYYKSLLPLGSASAVRDYREAFRIAERVAYIDIDVPTASKKPGVSLVKRGLRLLVAWYLNYITQQFNNFTSNLMRLISIMDQRLERLEEKASSIESPQMELFERTASLTTQKLLATTVADELKDCIGRILVAECGGGELLQELLSRKLDVYGVDQRAGVLDGLEKLQIDVRNSPTLMHLQRVGDSTLSGLVITGIVDRGTIAERVSVVNHAKRVLSQGSILVLVCTGVPQFADPANHLEFDLSLGRPFSPGTWVEILEYFEFSHVRVINDDTHGNYLIVANSTKVVPGTTKFHFSPVAKVSSEDSSSEK